MKIINRTSRALHWDLIRREAAVSGNLSGILGPNQVAVFAVVPPHISGNLYCTSNLCELTAGFASDRKLEHLKVPRDATVVFSNDVSTGRLASDE